jgi:hypothetical protein
MAYYKTIRDLYKTERKDNYPEPTYIIKTQLGNRDVNQLRNQGMNQVNIQDVNQVNIQDVNQVNIQDVNRLRNRDMNQVNIQDVNQLRNRDMNQVNIQLDIQDDEKKMRMIYEEKEYENTSQPDVFGPAFWFTLHNGASRYPVEASPFQAEKMKGFIRGIPVMLPCEKCSTHAQSYIESNNKLDEIVSGRENLFKFFWEFHNYVNKRYGKKEPTLEEAKSMFAGKVKVTSLKYE